MKKLISFLVTVLSFVAVSTTPSFATNDDNPEIVKVLRVIVDEMNAECPVEIDDNMVLNKAYLSNNRMVFNFLTDNDTLDGLILIKEMAAEEFEALIVAGMLEDNDEMLLLMAMCVAADYGLEFKFSNLSRTNSLPIVLTKYDLAACLDGYDLEEILTEFLLEYL